MTRFQRFERRIGADPDAPIEVKVVGYALMVQGFIFIVAGAIWVGVTW